ncbi:Type I Iterative PKS [Diaporthe eres]
MVKSKGGHFLDRDPAAFDAPFFSITASDAAAMDPQHRLALETTYHAFENAGIPITNVKGSRTSVYAASFTDDYTRMLAKDPDRYPRTTIMGTAPSILANRLSWYFDLAGPSMHVDTACSSSLVALDLACQSLRNGDASMALIVGTNMILGPEASVLLSNGDFLSPDGLCYSFDHRANGYARGEGIVCLIIKPVADAVHDGDMIRAVIRSSGSNQDGRTPVISQPSAQRQVDLMRHVYQKAGLDFSPVRYVEAHGTGTRIGDPIEIEALGRVFGDYRSASEPLYVGSVKANIGHCEGCAGLAGVLKAILVLEKGIIPPNALFETLNPDIDAERYHIAVPIKSIVWPNQGLRRVSVNSFGFGGVKKTSIVDTFESGYNVVGGSPTNGKDSISQATDGVKVSSDICGEDNEAGPSKFRILVFSAPDEKSLRRVVQGYKQYYKEHIQGDSLSLSQLAFTLAARRTHQLWRTSAVASSTTLDGDSELGVGRFTRASTHQKLVFVFTGQGAQSSGMGLDLLRYSVFKQTLEEVDKALGQLGCKWLVVDQIKCASTIHMPEYSQPLCTAVQIALVELLRSFGIVPGVVVGHSSGEIAAAYTAGALSLASACKVAYFRGQLAGKVRRTAAKSAMISVNLAADEVPRYLQKLGRDAAHTVTLACVNSPVNSTLSGPHDAIQAVQHRLDRDGIFAKVLNTGVAYHSPAMQSIVEEYLELMGQIRPRAMPGNNTTWPSMFSSITGEIAAQKLLADPQYWVDNLVSPVRFSEALLALSSSEAADISDFVEVGPHCALRRPIHDTIIVAGGVDSPPENNKIRYHSTLVKGKGASMPWVKEHEVTGRVLFPGAGMLVMALEAAKQMCPDNRKLSGILIKEAKFLRPILVPNKWEESIETFTQLRPINQAFEKQTVWFDVKITTYAEARWTECFTASIRVEFEDETTSQVDGGREKRHIRKALMNKVQMDEETCIQPLDRHSFYKRCHEAGLVYGESFQLLEDIRWDGNLIATACIHVASAQHKLDSLVHPAILDCALQLIGAQVSQGLSTPMRACVPSQLSDAWFSPQAASWQYPRSSQLRCSTTQTRAFDTRGSTTMAVQIFADDMTPLCAIDQLVTTSVSDSLSDSQVGVNGPRAKLLHGVSWKPQLSLLSPQQLHEVCEGGRFIKDETHMENFRCILDTTLDHVLFNVMSRLSMTNRQRVPGFLAQYVSWMEHKFQPPQTFPAQSADKPRNDVLEVRLETCKNMHPPWEIFSAVARNLHSILVGETDPLQVAFHTGLAEKFYVDLFEQTCDERFGRLLDLMAHENPCMRILEVGAGTGSMTKHILDVLGEQRGGGIKFAEYTYTDVSPAFFDKARARFSHFADRMHLQTFDLERNSLEQGFSTATYDVIFAGSVLHATADLADTLKNLRQLLKPGGRLVLLEIVASQSVVTNFAFGVLPGWWRCSEPWRKLCPAISEDQWKRILVQNGFSGTDLVLRDHASDACHIASIMVSTVLPSLGVSPAGTLQPRKHLHLVVAGGSEQPNLRALVHLMEARLPAWAVQVLPLDQLRDTAIAGEDVVMSLLEAEKPFLTSMADSDFQYLKHLVKHARNILWVSVADLNKPQYPHYSLMQGFLRSLRSENIDKRIISLSVEGDAPLENFANHFLVVFDASFGSQSRSPELEYRVVGDKINTLRAFECSSLNSRVRSLTTAEPRSQVWKDVPPSKLSVGKPGCLDSFEFIEDSTHGTPLGHEEIEIEAKAWGLSFRDVFVGLARLTGDDDLGYDCAGVVSRVGVGCCDSIKVGDRVCGVSLGCMRAFPRTASATIVKIPDSLSFEEAVSVVAPGCTAYYSLIQVGRLRKGNKVLIHSASGSTGQMAIWVAKFVGAEIFATVGYDEKKEILTERFGLAADHIFYSRNTSFARGILRVTNGYGVDMVLNSLSGDGLRASWECMAPYGRFIEIGKADITANSGLPMAGFSRNVSFTAVDLHHAAQTNPALIGELLQKTMELVGSRAIGCPNPVHVYSATKVEDAFRFLQSGRSTGRIVINVTPTDVVPTRLREASHWSFDENASYMVCGGLGGLGRAVAKWMASKGARNLILPSRSGPQKGPEALQTVLDLRQQGINVITPICDMSSATAVAETIQESARIGMPPIKGCINAAMVLQDAVLDNMSHAHWDLTVRSKAQTSWNLHQMLPDDLDFFVLLSSLAGINGSVAQSNYAAGCTFQDALARFRTAHSRGRRSIALDLGWMRNIGIISETPSYQHVREVAADMAQIEDEHLFAVLDMCCDPAASLEMPSQSISGMASAAGDSNCSSQLLIGIITPADSLARGERPSPLTQRPLFAPFSMVAGSSGNDTDLDGEGAPDYASKYAMMFRQSIMANKDSWGNIAATSKDKISPRRVVVNALAERLARSLAIAANDVQSSKRLDDYGVDSLVAVELRNWLVKDFSANVAVFEIMGGTTIERIGDLVVERTEIGKGTMTDARGRPSYADHELQRRLDQDPLLSNISVLALDPGAMPTGIMRHNESWFVRSVMFQVILPLITVFWGWLWPNGAFRTLEKSARDILAAVIACGPPPLSEHPKGLFLNGSEQGEYNTEALDPVKRDVVWRGSVRYAKLEKGQTLLEKWE